MAFSLVFGNFVCPNRSWNKKKKKKGKKGKEKKGVKWWHFPIFLQVQKKKKKKISFFR